MAPLAKLAVLGLAAAPALAAPTTKPFPAGTEVRSEDGTSTIQIVGGTAASAGDFPYIVSLSQGGSHFCGGVLVDATHVVTAAHCSVGQSASSVKVRAGSLNWSSGGTQVSVSKITVHPSYQSSTTNNDVAVWKLSTSIPASGNIGYATLPAQGSDPTAGTDVLVGGWGTTSEGSGSIPSALRKVTVPVVSRATCRSAYGTSAITDNMWCAGLAQGGKDSCQGDSGGPIVDASTKVLQGVVSWGEGCARANAYGVYTRIGNYVTWIKNNLN